MTSPRGSAVRTAWCWRRWIARTDEALWTERLLSGGFPAGIFIERPNRARLLLEIYSATKGEAQKLFRGLGGSIYAVGMEQWLKPKLTPPTCIGRRLEIIHGESAKGKSAAEMRLRIPHGLAFGSGEHGTTFMLLRALMKFSSLDGKSVLDLGTGSGVLALAARHLGARKIVATDFDATAVRTARENEALNFSTAMIQWRRADVKKLRPTVRYDLVLANIFSGILIETARTISASVKEDGQLWLSGILREQEAGVIAAYHKAGMRLVSSGYRGKWVMLQMKRVQSKTARA